MPHARTSPTTLMSRLTHLADERGALLVICFVLLTRVPLHLFTSFDFARLDYLMQALDPALLRSDLFGSLLGLHTQPPLYNLFVGSVLAVVPDSMEPVAMSILYTLLSLILLLGVHRLVRARGASPLTAVITAALFSLWPTLIWGERQPGYHLLILLALVWMACLLDRFVVTARLRHVVAFLLLATFLPLTRSFFHLIVWMIPVLIYSLLIARERTPALWKRFVVIAIICTIPVFLLYLRNAREYGAFTGSTWQGMNVAGITTHVPTRSIESMITEGEITPIARIARFAPPGEYLRYYDSIGTRLPNSSIVLDDTIKSTGAINWNHRIYAIASREYQANTFAIARTYPLQTALGVLNQAYIFCSLQTYTIFGSPDRWWVPPSSPSGFVKVVGLVYIVPVVMLLLLALAVWFYLREVKRALRNGLREIIRTNPTGATDLFIGFTIVYTIVIACVAELGEGSIMRAQIDPFLAVAVGVVVGKAYGAWRSKRDTGVIDST